MNEQQKQTTGTSFLRHVFIRRCIGMLAEINSRGVILYRALKRWNNTVESVVALSRDFVLFRHVSGLINEH